MKNYLIGIETRSSYFEIEIEASEEQEAMNKARCEISEAEGIAVDDMFVTLVEEI